MAITSKGFAGGPMTDDDFGAIAARGAWVESAAAYAVTQPNGGTRTVAVASGSAVAHGVRAVNDAAISQALTAPGAGGQWYLLVLRRDWNSGGKTTTLQVLSGPAVGSTTTPSSPPTSLPATFQFATGSALGDQPLAWVWVSSATAVVTIFDVRIIDFRNRALQAAAVTSLGVLPLIAALPIGFTMPCADGITYRWSGTSWRPWDSDWVVYRPTVSGISGAMDASPGWNPSGRVRYTAGKVRFEWVVALNYNNTASNGTLRISLPVGADRANFQGIGSVVQDGYALAGLAMGLQASTGRSYLLFQNLTSDSQIALGHINTSNYMDGSGQGGPFAWAGGDQLRGVLEYDPA